jgi:hypothetical protein
VLVISAHIYIYTYTQVLARTGTKRLIVGHTPQQKGINSAANERLWRVDTAMCSLMGYVTAYVIAYVSAGISTLRNCYSYTLYCGIVQ